MDTGKQTPRPPLQVNGASVEERRKTALWLINDLAQGLNPGQSVAECRELGTTRDELEWARNRHVELYGESRHERAERAYLKALDALGLTGPTAEAREALAS